MTRRVAPPTGSPPPVRARHGDATVQLLPLAEETARRHLDRHPEDGERYGGLAREWAVHDMQYVLAWAYGDLDGLVDLASQVAWLARVLDARGYPVANLQDCLRTAAGVVQETGAEAVAARLRGVADGLSAGP